MNQKFNSLFRRIRRKPLYYTLAVFDLALGTSIFLLVALFVQGQFAFDKNIPHHERVYRMEFGDWCVIPPALGTYMNGRYTGVEEICRTFFSTNTDGFADGKHFRFDQIVSADSNFIRMFGIKIVQGDMDALGKPGSIVLTRRMAQVLFGQEEPVGKIIRFQNRISLSVAAVVDEPERIHLTFDAIVPLETLKTWIRQDYLDSYKASNFPTYLRLKQGFDKDQIESEIEKDLASNVYPEENPEALQLRLRPVDEIYFFNTAQYEAGTIHGNRQVVWVLFAVGCLVLLLAVVNYINMATSEVLTRARETGLRQVLGASRSNLMGDFLTESFILSLAAWLTGILFVFFLLPYFNRLAGTSLQIEIPWSYWVVGPILLAILSGIIPSFSLVTFRPAEAIRGMLNRGKKSLVMRRALVVFQYSVSIALICGVFIVARQFDYLIHRDKGYAADGVIHFPVRGKVWQQLGSIREELRKNVAIQEVSLSQGVPGSMFNTETYTVNDREIAFRIMNADPWFIETAGFRISDGRNFDEGSEADKGTRVIINQEAARAIGWDQPVGKKLTCSGNGWVIKQPNPEIIGVIEDFPFDKWNEPVRPLILVWNEGPFQWVSVKYDPRNEKDVIEAVSKVWQNWEPDLPFEYKRIGQMQAESLQTEARLREVLLWLTVVAIFLAILGQFGMSGYEARRRRKEMAIRKVSGAGEWLLMGLIYKGFSRWVLLAAMIALPVAEIFGRRWLGSFPYRTEVGAEPIIFSVGIAWFVCLLTVSYHGWIAVTADPAEVLRRE